MRLTYSNLAGIITFFLLFNCLPEAAFGGILEGKSLGKKDEPVIIYAQQLEHRQAEDLLIAEGAVDIRHGSVRLRADRVELNTESGQVIAEGNVILDEQANRITGKRMEINIKTKLGTIYQGNGFLESGYYFSGKKVERTAEDEFIIEEGGYTSCDQPLPDWRLKAKRCRLHIEHYAYLSHFTFRLKDVPILYFPYGIFPIKTKRSSGFLIPRAGYSSQDGGFLKNSYFWAINDWSDATLGVDYFGKRGIGKNLEARYALSEGDKGQVNLYHIDDDITLTERWRVNLDIKQQLPYDVNGVVWVDALSDRQFDRQFANKIARRNRQEQESLFSFTKNWGYYNLNLWGNYFKDLYSAQKTISQRMPELNFNSVSQRLGSSPVFFEWETAFASLRRERGNIVVLDTQRADIHPRLSLPWKLHNGLVLTPSAGLWHTGYSNTPAGGSTIRNMYDLKLSLDGPQAYRTFEAEGWGNLEKVKHLVYPNITYTYIPYNNQNNLYNFDGLDRVAPAYKLDYSIINHLLGKFQGEGKDAQIRDLLTVTLSQSFDLAEERRMVNLGKNPRRPFSNLKLDVEVKPTPGLRLDTETYYNVYDEYIDRINSDFWLEPPGKIWHLTGGWRHARQNPQRTTATDFVRAGGGLRLGSWQLDGSTYYDIEKQQNAETRYKITYFSQCWGISLNYVLRPLEDEIGIMIDLKGLGSLGQGK